ncbi:MAG: hypothetical protein U1C55_04170 [Smithellaceae bacterium]|nr:hypothetical protein [Smithellaceae bacterium]
MENKDKKYIQCNTCTLMLVNRCYERRRWFPLIREPLVGGMRLLAWLHRIDPRDYPVRTAECHGCNRFMKTVLKDRSPVFSWLNNRINPLFDRLVEGIVLACEIEEAKKHARQATGDKEE